MKMEIVQVIVEFILFGMQLFVSFNADTPFLATANGMIAGIWFSVSLLHLSDIIHKRKRDKQ